MMADAAVDGEAPLTAAEDGMGKARTARRVAAGHSFDQALALHRQGRLEEADKIYDAILAAAPRHGDALHLSGVLKHQRGRSVEALRLVAAALRAKPDAAPAIMSHGLILDALKRHEEALADFDRLMATGADDAVLHYNRGNALKALGRHDDAVVSYQRAIALAPSLAEAHHNLGSTYADYKHDDKALASYDRALAVAPDSVEVLNNRGKVLQRLKRHQEAIGSFDRSLVLDPCQPDALCHRGECLAALDRFDEAQADYAQALCIDPNFADAHLKRGNALIALNRFAEALPCFAAALAVKPDNAEANFNEALTRLCLGDFRRGWQKYECRWQCQEFAKSRPDYPRPQWRGETDLRGKTILLVTEQGLGDAIQFVRYAPIVAALGAKVLLGVRAPLVPLMRSVAGVAQVFAGGEWLPEFDLYCPLLSLPLAFGTKLHTIPSRVPYIRADDERIARWRPRVPHTGRLRIGLCWAGTGAHPNDRRRSLPLERLADILAVPELDFISLQKDVSEADAAILSRHRVTELGQDFADFADTAAVVAMLDLVISVDTSVAHLAGAMGKATAVLLPFSPDFRWLLDRTDSPWYPTMRLYRQTAIGDWNGPLQQLTAELAAVARRRSTVSC
jgi:tetratricopeptide (TPR) repeat protein